METDIYNRNIRFPNPLPDWSANTKGEGGTKLLFGQIFPENCMTMKENEPREGCISLAPHLDPPTLIGIS